MKIHATETEKMNLAHHLRCAMEQYRHNAHGIRAEIIKGNLSKDSLRIAAQFDRQVSECQQFIDQLEIF